MKHAYGKLAPLLEKQLPSEVDGFSNTPQTPAKATALDSELAPDADPATQKINRAKVRLFFDKLKKSPTLMSYLNFTSPVEQAQAITEFSELVGVPSSQVVSLLTQIRRISKES
jgi:hypothetical protein